VVSVLTDLMRQLAALVRDLLPNQTADVSDAQRDDVMDAALDDDGMEATGL
jgi:hypothetical protein